MYLVVSHFYLEWRILKCCCWDQLKIWGSFFGKVNRCIDHQSTYVYVPLNCTWLVGHIIIITLCNVNSEEAAAKKKYFWSQSSVANFVEESLAEYEDGEKSRHRSWLMRTTSFTAGRNHIILWFWTLDKIGNFIIVWIVFNCPPIPIAMKWPGR